MLIWTKLTSMLQILLSNWPPLGVSLSLNALFDATLLVFGKSFKQLSGSLIDAQAPILWPLLELYIYVKVINSAFSFVWILRGNLPVYAFSTTSELLGRQVQLLLLSMMPLLTSSGCSALPLAILVLISHLPRGNRDIILIYIVFSLL